MRSLYSVVILAFAACTGGGGEPPGGTTTAAPAATRPAAPLQPGLYFASSMELLEHGVYTTQLNFADLRDLFVRLQVPRMPEVATATLTFINPKGETFYETNAEFSTDANMKEMNMPGVMHPLSVFHAKANERGYALDRGIPIAGSVLMRYPMEGPWQVMAKLDGQIYTAELQVRVAR